MVDGEQVRSSHSSLANSSLMPHPTVHHQSCMRSSLQVTEREKYTNMRVQGRYHGFSMTACLHYYPLPQHPVVCAQVNSCRCRRNTTRVGLMPPNSVQERNTQAFSSRLRTGDSSSDSSNSRLSQVASVLVLTESSLMSSRLQWWSQWFIVAECYIVVVL